MKLIKFYTSVIESLGLHSTSDGFIKHENENIPVNNKLLVMPVKEQLSNLTHLNNNGEYEVIKTLFNPLKENLIKKDSDAINYIKKIMEINFNSQALAISKLLLELGKGKQENKNLSLELNQFLILLETTRRPNTKELIDEPLVNAWETITKNVITKSSNRLIKLYAKKNIKKEGETYYRGLVLSSPLLDLIEEEDLTIKIRPKDKRVFKILINYMLTRMTQDEDNIISVSSDPLSPTFMCLIKGYKLGVEHMNKVLTSLSFIDKDLSEKFVIDIKYSFDDLDFSQYEKELILLPEITENGINEMETNVSMSQNTQVQEQTCNGNVQTPVINDSVSTENESDEMTEEEMRKMLYGGQQMQQQAYTPQTQQPYNQSQMMNPVIQQRQQLMPQPAAIAPQQFNPQMQQQGYNPQMQQQQFNPQMQPQGYNPQMQQQQFNPQMQQQQFNQQRQQQFNPQMQQQYDPNRPPFNGPYV